MAVFRSGVCHREERFSTRLETKFLKKRAKLLCEGDADIIHIHLFFFKDYMGGWIKTTFSRQRLRTSSPRLSNLAF